MPSLHRPAALALPIVLAACLDAPTTSQTRAACCAGVVVPNDLTVGEQWHWQVPAAADFPASAWILSFEFAGPGTISLTPGTNLIAQPDDLGDAYWTKAGGGVTADSVLAPTTFRAADRFVEDSSTGMHGIELATNLRIAAGTIHACRVDIHRVPGGADRYVRLAFGDPDDAPYVIVDPATGELVRAENYGRGQLLRYEIMPLANGWYRLMLTVQPPTTDIIEDIGIYLADATRPPFDYVADFPYAGDGTSGILLENVWVEAGLSEPSGWRIGAAATGGWDVTVSKATTAGYAIGRYRWAAFVTEAATGRRHSLATGWVELRRN